MTDMCDHMNEFNQRHRLFQLPLFYRTLFFVFFPFRSDFLRRNNPFFSPQETSVGKSLMRCETKQEKNRVLSKKNHIKSNTTSEPSSSLIIAASP